jgi:hypothetical protein
MHLAAASLGLSSKWNTIIREPYVHYMVKRFLGIPHEFEVYDMMTLGYPGFKPRPKFMKDTIKIIHYYECEPEEFRSDDEIKDFIIRATSWNIGTHRRKPDVTNQ